MTNHKVSVRRARRAMARPCLLVVAGACALGVLPASASAAIAPANTSLPVVSGTTTQGSTLTTSNGTWANSPTSYTYNWLRCDSTGRKCVQIAGATAQSYKLVAADVGSTLRSAVHAK